MKKILSFVLLFLPCLSCLAVDNVTINGLNYMIDSSDRTAIVSTQSTSLSGSVSIPSSVTYSGTTYSVTGLASKAFQGCDGITSVTIPCSITALSSYCFYDCDNLTTVTIPTSVTSIGDYCFNSCSKLSSLTIPSSVKTLGQYCFASSKIQNITIPSSVTSIGNNCFYYCSSLTSATINANVTSLPSSCFYSCTSLTSVSIPSTVTILDGYCFSGCSKLSSITLPSGLKKLNSDCFYGCTSLTEISLPASVTNINSECFINCTSLSKLTCNATTPPSVSSNAFNGTLYQYGTLLVPSSAVSEYQAATTWREWKYVKAIGSSVGTITSATINGLNYLLDSSDRTAIVSTQSTSLSGSVSIPSSVTYSGTTYSLTGLASKAFQDCDGITSVTIPSSITALSSYCFYDCDYLTGVTIPTSVTSIGDYCFYGCDRLSSLTIPSSVKTLGHYCFAFTKIQNTTIPSSVTSIGNNCFYHCSSLTSATINANVTSLPSSCFYSCTSLTSVSIPTTVTSLGSYCFSGCSSLTEISLPASVTSIGSQCFYNCASLSKLTCNATTPPSVYSSIFEGTLYQYGTLLVPSSAVSAYQAVATWKDWKNIQAIVVAENIVYLADATTAQNTTKQISVKLKNDSQITNFQFDVYLPAGITMATSGGNYIYAKGSRLGSAHSITCAQQSDGAYRFFCYSVSNALLSGNDGEIMNFTVQVPSTTAIDDYTITLKNAKVAETNGTKYATDETSAKLTVTQGSVPVTGITLNNTSATLTIGEMKYLSATVTPSNATNKNVTWTSSNTSVATVSTSGVVTAVGVGSATITCTAADGSGVSSTCSVSVGPLPDDTTPTDIASLSDAVYAITMEGRIGSQLVLPIQMKNSIAATGFQVDIFLPEGITVAEDGDGFPMVELSTQRTTVNKTNIFDCEYQAGGSLRIICNSTKGYAFTGSDGEVALVTLNIAEGLAEGDYPVTIKNTVITDALGTNKKKVDLVNSTLTLFAYTLGDANGDNEVDVADISAIASHVLGREVPGFVEKAADVNVDNEIDVADISALAYLILHPETAQKARAHKVAEKKENIENDDNTLYAEMLQAVVGTDVILPIMMRNSIEATGFQLDLQLPEGVTLKDATLSNARTTSKHTNLFDYACQADGTYRILCNSTKGLSFNGHDGEVMLITLHIDKDAKLGAQTIALKDMVLTDATGMLREESSISESTLWIGNATCIHEIASEKDAPAYDLQGRQVSKKQKGIVIRDGKKIMKK